MIDREWLDKKLRVAMFFFNRPIPVKDWPGILDVYELVFADQDENGVDETINRVIRYGTIDDLRPSRLVNFTGDTVSISDVISATCRITGIDKDVLIGAQRGRWVVRPRQIAMTVALEKTGASLPAVGRMFGRRDHTTVLHAKRKVADLIQTDKDVRDLYGRISGMVGHG